MHLSRGAYYADFFVLPIVGLALAGGSLFRANLVQSLIWGIICLSGVVTWTLLEYVLHRYVLHHVPGFEQMHDAHHADPLASVGAPIWVTLPMLCLCGLLPLWWPVGFLQASGLTTGLVLGYLWYITVHHASHRWHPDHRSYFYRRKRCHAQHHASQDGWNFGVTTSLWDHIFGTAKAGGGAR
ncbi:MAG: sterol desaturase family protein [Microvirga sp.]